MTLKGKTLFITGASRGIGLAIGQADAARCAGDEQGLAFEGHDVTPESSRNRAGALP